MTQKRSRGVQQADVWAAADALIAAGDRPTIERVRQKIGSGSPNTVSPMLDAWYRTLPARLGVAAMVDSAAGVGGSRLPPEVADAARRLWELACRDASALSSQANEAQRAALDRREDALTAAEAEFQRREQTFASTKASLEESVLRGNDTITGLQRQLDAAQQRQDAMERQVEQLREALAASQRRQEALRAEQAAALARKDATMAETQQRHDAAEHRALREIDRAREETRQAVARAARDAVRAAEAQATLGQARDRAVEALHAKEQAAATARQQAAALSTAHAELQAQLADTETRNKALAESLSVESAAHVATRALLTQAMALVASASASSRNGQVKPPVKTKARAATPKT
ncbi:DNA-binding protein [Variovorax sp. LT1R16]|uniref:DNA-binding protein n=1 Tax=Variovorax sp. LT1R16 TaxID=3443728 RepID=UPI003F457DCB